MKTTLNISDTVMKQLKETAARSGHTMSELVETALRNFLRQVKEPVSLPPLPSFEGGDLLVDVSNRDYVYDQMDDV